MKIESESLFQINKEGADFEKSLIDWKLGKLSSPDFYPIIFNKVLERQLFIGPKRDNSTQISQVPIDRYIAEAEKSPVIMDAIDRGLKKEEPDIEMVRREYYKPIPHFGLIDKRNDYIRSGSLNKLSDLWEYERIDNQLPSSLILHAHVVCQNPKLYEKGKEVVHFRKYRNSVYDALPKSKKEDATKILLWLNKESLLSNIRKFQIHLLMPLAVDQTGVLNEERLFFDFEHFFHRIAPIAYLKAWEKHINNQVQISRNSLPNFLSDELSQKTIRAFFYLRGVGKHRPPLVGDAIKNIRTSGNAEKARENLARIQAKAILENRQLPLEQWQEEDCQIQGLVEKNLQRKGITRKTETKKAEVKKPEIKKPELTEETKKLPETEKKVYKARLEPDKKISISEARDFVKRHESTSLPYDHWTSGHLRKYAKGLLRKRRGLIRPENYPNTLYLGGPINNLFESLRLDANQGIESYAILGFGMDRVSLSYTKLSPDPDINEGSPGYSMRIRKYIAVKNNLVNIVGEFQNNSPTTPLRAFGLSIDGIIPRPPSFEIHQLYRMLSDKKEPLFTAAVAGNTNLLIFRTNKTIPLQEEISQSRFLDHWYSRFGIDQQNLNQYTLRHVLHQHDQERLWPMNTALASTYNLALYQGRSNQQLIRVV